MSDLGSLYFSLGLNSDKFDKAIEAARKKVSDLGANVEVGVNLNIEDVGKQIQKEISKLQHSGEAKTIKIDFELTFLKNLEKEIRETESRIQKGMSLKFVNPDEIKRLENWLNNLKSQKRLVSEIENELVSIQDRAGLQYGVKLGDDIISGLRERLLKGERPSELIVKQGGDGLKPIQIKAQLDTDDIAKVKAQLDKLGAPIDVAITLNYDLDKFRTVETTLKNYAQNLTSVGNIKLGIDDSFLRTGMSATTEKGLKGWLGKVSDYLLGDDTGDAAKSVQQIQKILDSHPFKIKVTFDQQALISTMNKSLKGLPVKVDVDVAELQKKLKALKIPLAFNISQAINEAKAELKKKSFDAKLNLVIDRAKISKAIKEAFAKKGLEYQASPADVRNARILEIQQRMEQSQKKFDGHVKKSTQSTNKLGTSMRHASDWASQLANQFNNFISLYSIERFIRNLYTIGGEFQKQQIALRNMIGDVDKGNAIFERMKTLAVKSPFTFSELSSYTKQMAAYGIEYENLYDTTKRLADISAGVGVDMGRLILAFGQVRSAAVLRGQELRQFTEAGIPLVAELAKKFTELEGQAVSTGEVFDKISKREVSFDMVKDVLYDMTDPGGRFFEMQEELAESLAGKWSNLKDAWDVMIADIANGTNGPLNWLADTLTKLLKNSEAWVPAITGVVLALGAMRIAINGINLAMATSPLGLVGRALLILAPIIGGVVGHIVGLATESESATEIISKMRSELEGFKASSLENEQKAGRYLDTLKEQARTEDEKYELLKRQKKTFEELVKLYPKLMDGITLEKMTLEEIERIRKRIKSQTEADIAYQHDKNVRDTYNRYLEAKQNEKNTRDSFRLKVEGNWIQQLTAATQEDVDNAEDATKAFYEAYEEAKKAKEKWIQETFYKKPEVRDQWMLTADALVEQYSSAHLRKPSEESIYSYFDYLEGIFKDAKSKYDRAASNELKKPQKAIMDAVNAVNMGIGGKSFYDKKKKSGKTAAEEAAKIDIQAYVEALKNEISKISSQWNLFKDLMEASGNKKLSMNIAFGGQISFESQLEQLRSRIMEEAKKFKVGIGLYDLLGMGEKQLLDAGVEEKAAKALGSLIKAYNDENKKLKDESVKNFIEILNSSRDFAQQIDDIERELQKDLADLRSNAKGMSAEELKRRENELIRKAEEDKAKVQFEEFKKSSDWVKVFDDLDRVSDATLDKMIKDVERFAAETNLGVKETKELVEALGKLRDEAIDRNPFQGFEDAWNRLKELKQIIKNGTLVAGGTQYRTGSGTNDDPYVFHSKKEVEDGVADANKDLEDSALGVASKFDAVAKAADLLGGLFENMGLGASNFMSALSDIAGGIAGGALSGAGIAAAFGATGPWGAIIGAGVGALSALFAQVDKSLQRGIDASERREKEIGNVAEMLDKSLERNMGGIFTMKIDDTTAAAFNKIVNSYNETQDAIKEWNSGETNMDLYRQIREFSHLQKDTIDTIKEALEEDSYFDAQLAALKVQRDEVQKQMDLEDEKKKTDKDKMLDYQKQIAELDDAITHFAEDMANSLYGIDFKDWSEQLAESLVDAWASGEDAVQAYKNTVNDILRDLGVSIISQKIIQPLLDKTMTDFLAQFEEDNGVLTDASMGKLAGMADGAEYAASATEAYLEGLKKLGIDLSDTSEEAKSGLSKGIEGVTEDTANLLGSYLNAIRQSVHVKQGLLEKLVSEDVPQISYIAQAQLRELSQIQANTARNVVLVGEIRDLVNRVVDKGSNKLKV